MSYLFINNNANVNVLANFSFLLSNSNTMDIFSLCYIDGYQLPSLNFIKTYTVYRFETLRDIL